VQDLRNSGRPVGRRNCPDRPRSARGIGGWL